MQWEGVTYRMEKVMAGIQAGGWFYQILTWDKRYPRAGGGGRQCEECDVDEFGGVEGPFELEKQASEHLQSKLDKWRGE